jgi:hypothetical protein
VNITNINITITNIALLGINILMNIYMFKCRGGPETTVPVRFENSIFRLPQYRTLLITHLFCLYFLYFVISLSSYPSFFLFLPFFLPLFLLPFLFSFPLGTISHLISPPPQSGHSCFSVQKTCYMGLAKVQKLCQMSCML